MFWVKQSTQLRTRWDVELDGEYRYDKFILVAGRAKIAFSLEPEVLASVERLRARTGESRSAVISRAIRELTRAVARSEQVERYVQSYRERPESEQEVASARVRAKRLLSALTWEDE